MVQVIVVFSLILFFFLIEVQKQNFMVNQYYEMIFYFGGLGCVDFIGNYYLEKLFLFNIWEFIKLFFF